jgi:hypothetical protein
MDSVEGEEVARQANRNRACTQIVAMMDYKTVNRSDAKPGESTGFIRPIRPLSAFRDADQFTNSLIHSFTHSPLRPLRATCLQSRALTAPAGHWSLLTGHLLRVLGGAMRSNSCKSLISTIVLDIFTCFYSKAWRIIGKPSLEEREKDKVAQKARCAPFSIRKRQTTSA